MIARAERMHRELFRPAGTQQGSRQARSLGSRRSIFWKPSSRFWCWSRCPASMPTARRLSIEGGDLVIAGTRVLPPELRTATIHRLELPQGQFYRRLRLPAGRYNGVRRTAAAGCLVITLQKAGI